MKLPGFSRLQGPGQECEEASSLEFKIDVKI